MNDNILLEHLKRIQSELKASRERDTEILARLSRLEIVLARIDRNNPLSD